MHIMNTFIRQSGRDRQRNTDIYREIQIRHHQTHSRRTGTANY